MARCLSQAVEHVLATRIGADTGNAIARSERPFGTTGGEVQRETAERSKMASHNRPRAWHTPAGYPRRRAGDVRGRSLSPSCLLEGDQRYKCSWILHTFAEGANKQSGG